MSFMIVLTYEVTSSNRAPPWPVRHRLGWRTALAPANDVEEVAARADRGEHLTAGRAHEPRQPNLEAATSCGGEERCPVRS
jgi:hypothetical protein